MVLQTHRTSSQQEKANVYGVDCHIREGKVVGNLVDNRFIASQLKHVLLKNFLVDSSQHKVHVPKLLSKDQQAEHKDIFQSSDYIHLNPFADFATSIHSGPNEGQSDCHYQANEHEHQEEASFSKGVLRFEICLHQFLNLLFGT